MKNQNYATNRQFTTLPTILMLLSLSLVALLPAVKAQVVGDYAVPVRTKKYARLANPLIKNTEPVEVTIVNGEAYLQGDISLGSEAFLDTQNLPVVFSAIGNPLVTGRWEDGIVPYVILGGFTAAERQTIFSAMNHIAQKTHVCFRTRTTEGSYIKFRKYTVAALGFSGGQSKLGKCIVDPECGNGQEIKLSSVNDATVRHEIGHSLGLIHEQARNDRDQYVEILWDNIEAGHAGNFTQVPFATIDIGNYDFNSIMHYRYNSFGKKVNGVRKQTIRRRNNPSDISFGTSSVYSAGDIAGVNNMYPNEQNCPYINGLAPGELAVGQSRTVTIHANEVYNLTNIYMRSGQTFQFTTASPAWQNGSRNTDAGGYSSDSFFDNARRRPVKMMALVGEIFAQNSPGPSAIDWYKLGLHRTLTLDETGYLIAFANDCLLCYGDNSGVVTLTVKRIG